MQSKNEFLDCITKIAALCEITSAAILRFYGNHALLKTVQKDNHTPLTQADLTAHDLLVQGLPAIINIPVISEESVKTDHNHDYNDYWLIDPIDGTREFINQTGEFCICIARVENHRPTLSLIYSPTTKKYWFAGLKQGSWHVTKDGGTIRLQCRPIPTRPTIITSQFKMSKRMKYYLQNTFGEYDYISGASALKFCKIIEGKADIYPKLSATTSEWDTVAGDLLLNEAGGKLRYFGNEILAYGTRDTTLNPPFIAFGAGVSETIYEKWFAQMTELFKAENREPLS